MTLPHRLDRTITIRAGRDTVFAFFTDAARWAAWWGAGSTIDARPGGDVRIRYPDGTEVSGEVLELLAPERISFTYGYASGQPIAPGGSRVTIELQPDGDGTRLHLWHEFADEATRDQHLQGWRYQLALFSNVVANHLHADAAARVDAWFEAWREVDVERREKSLSAIASAAVRFRDRFGCTEGIADLLPHISAAQRFMPEIQMRRHGSIRHCQGTVLVDWAALTPDGQERGAGTNVFVFAADGRIESVTGFGKV
jgi:uncharacterized protein YndB with AHSA1/START domain